MRDRNYSAFWALLSKMPHADKASIVYEWTGGRTDSLREMTDTEYRRMIAGLNNAMRGAENLKAARSRALHQLQLYGLDTLDWGAVNRFVGQPRIMGKEFARLTHEELVALTKKMRAINAKPRRHRPASSPSPSAPAEVPVRKPSYIVVPRPRRGEG